MVFEFTKIFINLQITLHCVIQSTSNTVVVESLD